MANLASVPPRAPGSSSESRAIAYPNDADRFYHRFWYGQGYFVGQASAAGFEELRRYTVADTATWAQPTISGHRVFIKDTSTLTWTFD